MFRPDEFFEVGGEEDLITKKMIIIVICLVQLSFHC